MADRVNRRAARVDRHGLRISAIDGALQVNCSCGVIVGGRRGEDTTMMTLSDLLELVRIHSAEVNNPR